LPKQYICFLGWNKGEQLVVLPSAEKNTLQIKKLKPEGSL
jgi:hypothetical protein